MDQKVRSSSPITHFRPTQRAHLRLARIVGASAAGVDLADSELQESYASLDFYRLLRFSAAYTTSATSLA